MPPPLPPAPHPLPPLSLSVRGRGRAGLSCLHVAAVCRSFSLAFGVQQRSSGSSRSEIISAASCFVWVALTLLQKHARSGPVISLPARQRAHARFYCLLLWDSFSLRHWRAFVWPQPCVSSQKVTLMFQIFYFFCRVLDLRDCRSLCCS